MINEIIKGLKEKFSSKEKRADKTSVNTAGAVKRNNAAKVAADGVVSRYGKAIKALSAK